MADTNTLTPTTAADAAPPVGTDFEPAAPLKDAGVSFEPAGERPVGGALDQARAAVRENVAGFGQQAGDKARGIAETGKEKVGGLLDQLAALLTDAAGQVDERLGEQYGAHARTAASTVQEFAQTVRDKDVDELAADVRGYMSKSPAIALGVAAALGFGLARIVHAGIDQRA